MDLFNDEFQLAWSFEKGPFVQNDSIVYLNPIKTKRFYLARILDIRKNSPYSEQAFKSISNRLERIPFLTFRSSADVSFQADKAWTYLNLEEGNTGSFQGIIGIQPDPFETGQTLVTGNLDLQLLNLFRSGKELAINWNRFAAESQELNLRYKHPFFLGTGVGIWGQFEFLKQDSSFVNQSLQLGSSIYISDRLSLDFSYKRVNGNVLTSDSLLILRNEWIDYSQDWYQVGIGKTKPIIIGPGQYFFWHISGAIGQRSVQTNPNLPESYFDSLDAKVTNYELKGELELQEPIRGNMAIYSKFTFAHQSKVFANQAYRLGGLRTLRGFNEQFFFSTSYVVNQAEIRYFFESESFFHLFTDVAMVELDRRLFPVSFGGGFSLKTKSGLFSFAMALGRTPEIPLDLANMKVHFGYLSRF